MTTVPSVVLTASALTVVSAVYLPSVPATTAPSVALTASVPTVVSAVAINPHVFALNVPLVVSMENVQTVVSHVPLRQAVVD